MTRDDALQFLLDAFAALATKAGLVESDDADGFGPAIDAALRALGYSRGEILTAVVPTAQEGSFEALLRYHGLARIWAILATREDVDLSGAGLSVRRSQPFAAVQAMLAEYKQQLEDLGLLGSTLSIGRLNLDFIEPARVA